MNILLWIIQIILAIKLITVTFTHGFGQSRSTMQAAIQKMGSLSRPLLYIVALAAFLATIGLILPEVLGSPAWITPLTSGVMSVLLLVSLFFHIIFREKPQIFVSVVLFVLAAFVAYGRWVLLPL